MAQHHALTSFEVVRHTLGLVSNSHKNRWKESMLPFQGWMLAAKINHTWCVLWRIASEEIEILKKEPTNCLTAANAPIKRFETGWRLWGLSNRASWKEAASRHHHERMKAKRKRKKKQQQVEGAVSSCVLPLVLTPRIPQIELFYSRGIPIHQTLPSFLCSGVEVRPNPLCGIKGYPASSITDVD